MRMTQKLALNLLIAASVVAMIIGIEFALDRHLSWWIFAGLMLAISGTASMLVLPLVWRQLKRRHEVDGAAT